MKTTARMLVGLMVVAVVGPATVVNASSIGPAARGEVASLVLLQSGPTALDAASAVRRQSDDLLARARQAMDEGQLDVADQLIRQAEELKVSYSPLNPLADTPAKIRRELRNKQTAAGGRGGLLPALPFGARTQVNVVPPDAFAQANSVQLLPEVTPPPGRPVGINQAPVGEPGLLPSLGGPSPGMVPPPDNAGYATAESMGGGRNGNVVLQARRALAMGDVRRATELAGQAKSIPANYAPGDDTPDAVLADINKYNELMPYQRTHGHTEAYRRQLARLMLQQADALLKWNDYNEAERLANQARDQRVEYGPMEMTPDTLIGRVAAARRAGGGQMPGTAYAVDGGVTTLQAPSMAAKQKVSRMISRARAALAGGDLASAQAFAQAATALQVPESSFGPGEDRPGLVMLDIQKAIRAGGSGVVQASATSDVPVGGQYPANQQATRAVYEPANDPTRNVRVNLQESPAVGTTAMTLFQQGEEALKARRVDEAMQFYRQAAQYRDQLDPATAQLLQDRLQMLGRPAAPQAPQGTLVDDAMARQQLLARQVNSDVAHQERRAAQIRQSNPKEALALLEQTRARVEAAGLEPNARTLILKRVDRNIGELRQYIDDNQATIALGERNNQTRDQIDRQKQYDLDVKQRLGSMAEKFNQLCDEQRYAEAEVVAKEAYDLAPNNEFAQQLLWVAKFVRRNARNREIAGEKEEGFLAAMDSVDEASTPFDDRQLVGFMPATDWNALTQLRQKFKSDAGRERTGHELEIQRKLKMPVSVQFSNMPLAQVVEQLQRLADINIYLDPQGLQEEGVDSSTAVNINLPHEISLESALKNILEPLHLTYVIKSEVLKITSEQYRNSETYTVTYDVADLVMPIPNFVPNSRMGLGGSYNDAMARNGFNSTYGSGPMGNVTSTDAPQNAMVEGNILAQVSSQMPGGPAAGVLGGGKTPSGMGPGGLGGGTQADFDPLIELITSTVQPDSWVDMGGNAPMPYPYENNLTLVITQTEQAHAEIVAILAQLRRLQDLQVTIEVRFITLNDDFFESIRVDFDFDIDDDIDRPFQIFGKRTDTSSGDDDDDTTTNTEPPRDTTDKDHGRSVTVGMSAPGVFSADLDVPFTQGSYALAVPQFGGFDASAGASLGFAVLSDIEAFFFINAAQGDSRTNILQAPKVTLFNGQTAYVSDTSQSPFVMGLIPVVGDFAAANQPVIVILTEGTFMTVQAVVSHDRRFVRLTVIPFFSQIGDVDTFTFSGRTTSVVDTSTEGNTEDPDDATKENNVISTTTEGTTVQLPTFSSISVSTTVSVPDGGTVLLGGIKRLSEGRNEYGTPILNKIPYLNRLFKNVGIGRETQSLMMTVTPRIIILEEEEERIGAGPAGP